MARTPGEALALLVRLRDEGTLDAWCEQHQVDLLAVFGSTARYAGVARDLDVAVSARSPVLDMVAALVDRTGCDVVDLLDLDRADAVATERALVGCVPLFESDVGLLARTRATAIVVRMDTDWLRRLDLDALAAP